MEMCWRRVSKKRKFAGLETIAQGWTTRPTMYDPATFLDPGLGKHYVGDLAIFVGRLELGWVRRITRSERSLRSQGHRCDWGLGFPG